VNSHPDQHESEPSGGPTGETPGFWRSRYGVGFMVIGAAASYFLLTEHLAHVVGALPFLLLLSCPLMHFFMHGGHGHRHNGDRPKPDAGKAGQPEHGERS
jgi:Protein of unknown function (DUF2933)